MWCAACRADVAAELSADNRRMLCARCHSELGTAAGAQDRTPVTAKTQDTERNARELLARWSTQHILEPPIASGPAAAGTPSQPEPRSTWEAAARKPAHRFDAAHAAILPPIMATADTVPRKEAAAETTTGEETAPEKRRRRKSERPRLAAAPAEHPQAQPLAGHDDLVRKAVQQPIPRHGNWTTTIGQLCAYGGVAVLTLGTVMVLAGYFGGPANYAPTGWLVAAVGQMLLVLGVITLVSGGMEQTVDEVAWRIDHLAEQIFHMEQMMIEQEARLNETRRRELRRARMSRGDQADAA
jgi:hypothetical protein